MAKISCLFRNTSTKTMMMRKKLKKKRYESPCFDQYSYDVIVCVVTYMLSVATFVYIALIHILSLFVCADLSRNHGSKS